MYALAPYFIRCFNPHSEDENHENRYDFIDRIGQYDMYELLIQFIEKHKAFTKVEEKKQTYKFLNIKKDAVKRTITGWMCVGDYGFKNDIINTIDSQLAFEKQTKHADVRNYYFNFYLPKESRKGIALMYTFKSDGVKSLFLSEFATYFKNATTKNVQMQILSYEKAMVRWLEADMKEIKVFGFKPPENLEDQISELGDIEHEYVIKAKRNKTLGKLGAFMRRNSDEYNLIGLLEEQASQVKATVTMNGSKKTFVVGHSGKQAFCQIEIDLEKVDIIEGYPDFDSIDNWSRGIMSDIIKTINL